MRRVRVNNPVYRFNAVDRLLNDFMNQGYKVDSYGKNEFSFQPATNILESENAVQVEMLVPGFEKEQIKIQVEMDNLLIKGEVEEGKATAENYKHIEFRKQNFEKKFKLSEKIDVEKISASFKNGILTLSIPKKAEVVSQIREIEVN